MKWDEFQDSILIQPASGGRPSPKPSDSTFKNYESRAGYRVPLSYKNFLMRFGPGLLHDFILASPGYPELGEIQSLEQLNEWYYHGLDPTTAFPGAKNPERHLRLLVFAKNSGGDLAGWDLHDVRDAANAEYGVYLVLREPNAVFAAASFAEFVMECCCGLRFNELVGDDSTEVPPRTFIPD